MNNSFVTKHHCVAAKDFLLQNIHHLMRRACVKFVGFEI